MRTRFLNINYFGSAPTPSLQTLTFFQLPVPRFSPPTVSAIDDLLRFDSSLDFPFQVDWLPIDAALSKFFSDVLPTRVNAQIDCYEVSGVAPWNKKSGSSFGNGNVENLYFEKEAVIIHEKNEVEIQGTLRPGKSNVNFQKHSCPAPIGESTSKYKVIQFETPELEVFPEDACTHEDAEMKMLSEVPIDENNLGMVKTDHSVQFLYELLEPVYSVADITSEHLTWEKSYSWKEKTYFQDSQSFHQCTFPILEVNEESLGILTCLSMEQNVSSHFEIIEQNLDEKYELVESKELFGSIEYDIFDFLSDLCISKYSLLAELSFQDILPVTEFVMMLESAHIHQDSALQGTSHAGSDLSTRVDIFEEFHFLDEDMPLLLEAFFNTQSVPEASDLMLLEDTKFKNFDELILCHELVQLDNTFKSLPVPVISDHGKMRSLYVIVDEVLANLKPKALSTSDGIYLNWDLLVDDKINCKGDFLFDNMWAKIDFKNFGFDQDLYDNKNLVYELICSDDTFDVPNMDVNEELQLQLLSGSTPLSGDHLMRVAPSKEPDDRGGKDGKFEELAERNAERASLLFKSMSQVSNLDYFLNPQKATSEENIYSTVKSINTNSEVPKTQPTDTMVSCRSSGVQSQEWNIKFYWVNLTEDIVALAENFEKSYMAILQSETELLKNHHSFSAGDCLKFLSLSNEKLMEYYRKGENMAFIALYVIKQAAWYMSFYGLHPMCLYVDKLCQALDYLKSRLGFLWALIKDADVDNKITAYHPAFTFIREILQSMKQCGLKVLIVADQIVWGALKSLLLSMGISFNEPKRSIENNIFNFVDMKYMDFPDSDCLLISHEHVSALFPFNKFSIILEYGGSYSSSRISGLSPNLVGLPQIHFLKVELTSSSVLKALTEGVEVPKIPISVEEKCHPLLDHTGTMDNQKLEELLKFYPIEDKYDTRASEDKKVEACHLSLPIPPAREYEHSQQNMTSFPESVIIVNTQDADKQMIISRRSTYQLILAMEKAGVQVVERDLNLPVDIIISPAVCIAWYVSENIGKKATPLNEVSSCLSLYVENIAANVLTSLSFTFSGCFLVFEGETNFLVTLMESSDGLHAAASSLGMELQLFFSHSSELTNEIILNCIRYATKLTRGLYPKMPESISLAESFLTQFPSINPLVAHAILSSGGMLRDFFGWSHEHRLDVLKKFNVSDESVALLSTFCRYGEREDSKSVMTDCSSSMSSNLDSDMPFSCKVDSEGKRHNCISSLPKFGKPLNEPLEFEPLDQLADGILNHSIMSNSSDSRLPGGLWLSDEQKNATLFENNFFGEKNSFDAAMLKDSSRVAQQSYGSKSSKLSQLPESFKKTFFPINQKLSAQNNIPDALNRKMGWKESQNLHEDVWGEVIGTTGSPLFEKDLFLNIDSLAFPSLVLDIKNERKKEAKMSRSLSFGNTYHPNFPTAAEVNSSSNVWSSQQDMSGEAENYTETDFEKNATPLVVKRPKKLIEEVLAYKSRGNFHRSPFQEEISHFRETPLSRALHSTDSSKNAPWTLEFLNRIKEKRKLRQQSPPCDTPAPCSGHSGSTSRLGKRRSPSILEFFKYQHGSTPGKILEQKRQKQTMQSSILSKRETCSASQCPTWTPSDKRARQILTFATDKSGSQTKLVWSDGTHGAAKKFRCGKY